MKKVHLLKFTYDARRWDQASHRIVVTATDRREAEKKVFDIAEKNLPHPEEPEIRLDLVSIEELLSLSPQKP